MRALVKVLLSITIALHHGALVCPGYADEPPAPEVRADAGLAQSDHNPRPAAQHKLKISRETTRITEPLRPDGYVDYRAALNAIASQGVTPENNAAVLLLQAFGPGAIPPELRVAYFQRLGVPVPPADGSYLITFDEYRRSIPAGQSDAADSDKALDQFFEATERPWSRDDMPLLAAWLDVNEGPLGLVAEAVKRPRCYLPLVITNQSEPFFADQPGMLISQFREAARLLQVRALLRVHEHQLTEAWQDILTLYRLSNLLVHQPQIVEAIVGLACRSIATETQANLSHYGQPTADQVAQFQNDLKLIPRLPSMADRLDVGDRFGLLDGIAFFAREGYANGLILEGDLTLIGRGPTLDEILYCALIDNFVDWNLAATNINCWYDRTVKAAHEPDRIRRREKLAAIGKQLARLRDQPLNTWASLVDSPSLTDWASRRVTNRLLSMFLSAGLAALSAEDRSRANFDTARIALALAAYRSDHTAYPKTLTELTPKYLPELPTDIFATADADYIYRPESDGFVLYSVGPDGKDEGAEELGLRDPGFRLPVPKE